jgi:putative hydrolase of the HAD superfamily
VIQPKAVIFDYGNVLCEAQKPSDIQAMANVLDLARASFEDAYWRFRVAYDEAQLDPISYWRAVAESADRTVTSEQVESLRKIDIESWIHPNPAMVDWAKNLRQRGMKTAVLSNMPVDLREYLAGPHSWLPEFDHMTFSCDVRSSKPDAAIYQHCLEGLGVVASEALFLDDREPNVTAARDLGMRAVLFDGKQQRFGYPPWLALEGELKGK